LHHIAAARSSEEGKGAKAHLKQLGVCFAQVTQAGRDLGVAVRRLLAEI
jgi:hypothetical protein